MIASIKDGRYKENTAKMIEYRNKTKNQQWDLDAEGKMYLTGFYAGDFSAKASISKKLTSNL